MMSSHAFETLFQINVHLRSALPRLHPEQAHCLAMQPQDFSDLLAVLLRGGECVRELRASVHRTPETERQISQYRTYLETLKQCLLGVHGRLLAERDRLENTRMHVAAAEAWAQASKRTL